MNFLLTILVLTISGCLTIPIDHSTAQFNNQVENMLNKAINDCENSQQLNGVSNVKCEGYLRNITWETIND